MSKTCDTGQNKTRLGLNRSQVTLSIWAYLGLSFSLCSLSLIFTLFWPLIFSKHFEPFETSQLGNNITISRICSEMIWIQTPWNNNKITKRSQYKNKSHRTFWSKNLILTPNFSKHFELLKHPSSETTSISRICSEMIWIQTPWNNNKITKRSQ